MELIDRRAAIKAIHEEFDECLVWDESGQHTADEVESILTSLPSADAVEVVRCKDCKHQEKYFHADGRMKGGGRFIYGCDLAEEYSHVCLDDDFCSRGERKDG